MSFVRLCQTREVLPQEIEHYLSAHQDQNQTWTWTKRGLFVDPAPDALFHGAKILSKENPGPFAWKHFLKQRRSPLFPIKRYRQFEDRDQKLRLHPTDQLIQKLQEGDALQISFQILPTSRQDRLRKWAQSSTFNPHRYWDQYESRTWHRLSLRNFAGRLWRWSRQSLHFRVSDPKQSLRHDREGPVEAVLDKLSRPLFLVEIRATQAFHNFSQSFTLPYLGELLWSRNPSPLILSSEELATLLSVPSLSHLRLLESESCAHLPGDPHIPVADRLKHLHIVGKTGMGKSTAILELFQKDLRDFPQIMIMDPHGDLVERARHLVPESHRLIVLDPSNREYPLALNPLELSAGESLEQRSSSLLEMFYALSNGSWGPRLEYLLRNTLLTLLLCPNTTLMDVPRLLTQKEATRQFAHESGDMELQRFWDEEFLSSDARLRQEMIAPILNKVGPLFSTPLLRNIFGQPRAKFKFDEILEKPAVILVPLSKSRLGEDASRLLGMTLISLLHSSLLKRTQPHPLALTLDEFQNFATPTLMTMLSESRKFGLALTLAHQYLKQVSEPIMDAILGNVGSHCVLRTSYEDAERLAPMLDLETADLINLPELNAYLKILNRGQPQATLRHTLKWSSELKTPLAKVHEFGRPRSLVEAKLKARYTKRTFSPRP